MFAETPIFIPVVLFVATLIRSAFGFGEALIAVPLLALVVPDRLGLIIAVLHPARIREAEQRPVPEGIAADRAHHEEDDGEDDPEDRNRPEQTSQDEPGHPPSLLDGEHPMD